jgi:tungstate transport system substrate-binding protein
LQLGAQGNADVLLAHSPAAEEEFMAAGYGSRRDALMHNDFVIVGPPGDPAGIAGATTATDAMARIAHSGATFLSRGDDSGTNAKELELWREAKVTPAGDWYQETGQGMSETLTIADQKQAYTLSDRGTFLVAMNVDAELLVEGGAELRNPYHVIVVRRDGGVQRCASTFSTWITSPSVQRTISRFGVGRYGEPLFFPDAAG